MQPQYEAAQLGVLQAMLGRGSSSAAAGQCTGHPPHELLAEAELSILTHTSSAAYVAFPLLLPPRAGSGRLQVVLPASSIGCGRMAPRW